MNQTEVKDAIREIIGKKILSCDTSLVDNDMLWILDSLGRITLLVELENRFDVELTDANYDLDIFSSLDKLADFVSSRKMPAE